MRFYALSDVGVRRDHNEDTYLADENLGLFVVADGMGGHRAGETASHIAVDTLKAFFERVQEAEEMSWPFGFNPQLSVQCNRLYTAIQSANRRVWKLADTDDAYFGMGTTLSALVFGEEGVTVSSVGDSRVYRFKDGRLSQLTEDDTLLTAQMRKELGPDKLATHPYRNVLTSAIGAKEELDVESEDLNVESGDLFLLCSDGLHSQVSDDVIERVLAAGEDLEKMAAQLVNAANAAGGKDNVTVVLVSV